MSKAEELLNSLDDNNGIMLLLADESTEPHIIIGSDRIITVPDQLKRIAVQYDHNVETVTFDCPRYWDEHDMSEWAVYINYRRPDNKVGEYIATDIMVDDSNPAIMHFNWTISKNVTRFDGKITFNICIQDIEQDDTVSHHWNSELCEDCYISEGFETSVSDGAETISSDTLVFIGTNELTAISQLYFDTSNN